VRNLRRVVAMLFSLQALALGCYSPNILDRGYACGDHGECPTHFHCASNHLCYQGDAGMDMQVVCDSDASAPQVCTAGPAKDQACNPVCQTGCDSCGWCAVVDGTTRCLKGKAGTKNVGAVCTPSLESDCMPGLYCQPECGSAGRCYRICDAADKSVCGSGSMCNVAGNPPSDAGTSFTLCSLVSPGTCDPIAQTGCETAAYACYPTVPNECDCVGLVPNSQGCNFAADCVRGSSCVQLSMATKICLQTCKTNQDCTAGGACNTQASASYGFCM
jgi:hypothetical protein